MKRIGFDNDKYLSMQSAHIRERIEQFGDKLYLEFGGKLFDDYHASRVLPGFAPDSKLQMLLQLADQAEMIISINAADIERNKIRHDLGITYDQDVIRLIDVYKEYDNGTKALKGVNLRIDDGEFVFLVGPSGSGKSTVIKLITGEIATTQGRLMVNGYNLSNIAPRQIPYMRRTLGIIFQDFRLIEKKTVYENLAFAMRAIGASPRELRRRIPYVLQLVGLEQKADRYPGQISGGEQQRVAIARALVNNPSMIIADEPTGNLDPQRSLEIMMLLERINELGTTVLVVTHEKALVNRFTKRVVAIEAGRIISDETGGYYNGEKV